MQNLGQLVADYRDTVIRHRRYLHANPELSFQESGTADYIRRELCRCKIPCSAVPGTNSVIGRLQGAAPGKTVAFRADIDALGIPEKNDIPHRSRRDGVMHACAHDGHTAALLGLAELLAANSALLSGEVVLLFQHAEELLPGGAARLVEAGVLDGVDAVFGAHIWTPLEIGTVGCRGDAIMASADRFSITLRGQGGHGSEPQHTDDVLLLGTAIVQGLQSIVSRRVDPRIPAVLSVCQFHAGSAFNVIPDECLISGTVRTCDEAVRARMPEQIRSVAEGVVSSAAGAACELDYVFGYPALVNDSGLAQLLAKAVREDTAHSLLEVQTIMGADDFAYYAKAVPSVYFLVGGGNADKGLTQPHHSPVFDFDEDAMGVLMEVLLASYRRFVTEA